MYFPIVVLSVWEETFPTLLEQNSSESVLYTLGRVQFGQVTHICISTVCLASKVVVGFNKGCTQGRRRT